MLLSIIIPCLNEEQTLAIVIKKALLSLKRLNISGEVIVADNGSTDRSVEIAKGLGARVIYVKEKGYGNALIAGMSEANGKYLLMGDADDSYNFEEIDEFVKYIQNGYDLVIGTRIRGKIEKGAMPFLHRYLGTPVLTFILNLLFKTKISDCNSGMRCLTKEAFYRLCLDSQGMEFASEMLIKSGLLKLKIKEIPITLYKDKRNRAPHLNTWRDGWRHLKFMFLYSPTYLFLMPGFVFMLAGFLLMFALLGGPLNLFGITFDYHTALLGSLLAILGYQVLITGVQAKAYAQTQKFKFKDSFIKNFYKIFTVERGLVFGLLLFSFGFFMDLYVVYEWVQADFQNLHEANVIALSSSLMILGIQSLFSSFFLSILNPKI
ncbi:MAG: glycosyltransferase family 2 protein [Candidatus Gracilibacteria bacterium]